MVMAAPNEEICPRKAFFTTPSLEIFAVLTAPRADGIILSILAFDMAAP